MNTMMNYTWILFDVDDTLFDYSTSEREALAQTLEQFGVAFAQTYLEAYHEINDQLWKDFEQGLVTQERLKVLRFARLFEACALDPAPDPVDFSARYLQNLSMCAYVFDDVKPVIRALHGKVRLALITNGLQAVQHSRLELSSIAPAFEAVTISEEVGCSKPDAGIFDVAFRKMGNPSKTEVLMVGDSLSSDICGGNAYGLDTCWLNREGRLAPDDASFQYEIHSLSELLAIVFAD